jgi:hypothetical protein
VFSGVGQSFYKHQKKNKKIKHKLSGIVEKTLEGLQSLAWLVVLLHGLLGCNPVQWGHCSCLPVAREFRPSAAPVSISLSSCSSSVINFFSFRAGERSPIAGFIVPDSAPVSYSRFSSPIFSFLRTV